jgi:hypothetical protein
MRQNLPPDMIPCNLMSIHNAPVPGNSGGPQKALIENTGTESLPEIYLIFSVIPPAHYNCAVSHCTVSPLGSQNIHPSTAPATPAR